MTLRFAKEQIDKGELGDIRYIYSQRLNLGRIRSDVDALWNFAPHDVSIIQFLLGEPTPLKSFLRHGFRARRHRCRLLNICYEKTSLIFMRWLDPENKKARDRIQENDCLR